MSISNQLEKMRGNLDESALTTLNKLEILGPIGFLVYKIPAAVYGFLGDAINGTWIDDALETTVEQATNILKSTSEARAIHPHNITQSFLELSEQLTDVEYAFDKITQTGHWSHTIGRILVKWDEYNGKNDDILTIFIGKESSTKPTLEGQIKQSEQFKPIVDGDFFEGRKYTQFSLRSQSLGHTRAIVNTICEVRAIDEDPMLPGTAHQIDCSGDIAVGDWYQSLLDTLPAEISQHLPKPTEK